MFNWQHFKESLSELTPYALAIIIIVAIGLIGQLLQFLIVRWVKKRQVNWGKNFTLALTKRIASPLRLLIPVALLFPLIPAIAHEAEPQYVLRKITLVALIFSTSWLLIKVAYAVEDWFASRYDTSDLQKFRDRKIRTQLQYMRRIIIMVVVLLAVSFTLLSFEGARKIGQGLLTSAGVAGIILGFAAQKTIANLLAGFQIAFTQPIRLGDVVIVENEWGKINEINLTYVVVAIWDERNLVLPITYFVEKPFQNWTRNATQILGTVFLHVDYRMPIDPLRKELGRILRGSELWDGRVENVVVTNSKETTMEIRCLVSARNASEAWDLRCVAREKLIHFINTHYPQHLPLHRAQLQSLDDQDRPPFITEHDA